MVLTFAIPGGFSDHPPLGERNYHTEGAGGVYTQSKAPISQGRLFPVCVLSLPGGWEVKERALFFSGAFGGNGSVVRGRARGDQERACLCVCECEFSARVARPRKFSIK